MGLESATFIQDLVATNPLSSDPRSQGDDHLRLLKSVLKNSFPNINAEVVCTSAELNTLQGVTGSLVDQLNEKVDAGALAAYASLSQPQVFLKAQGCTPVALGSVSGSITLDLSLSNVLRFTVAAEVTEVLLSNAVNGKPYVIKIINTSGLPVNLGSLFSAASGVHPNVSLQGTHFLDCIFTDGSMVILREALQVEAL